MITKKTVLVLGAGASHDYGFPLGNELVDQICRAISVNSQWVNEFIVVGIDPGLAVQFGKRLSDIRPVSVDAFLADDRHNQYAKVAKAATARALIPYETPATCKGLEDTKKLYMGIYWRMETQLERFRESASNLTFITFNYDRSLEYFFWSKCRGIAHGNLKEATDLFKLIRVIHVYGMLGKPDFVHGLEPKRPFLFAKDPANLRPCMSNMWMITEVAPNASEFEPENNPIRDAEVVCFLGFGYAPENLKQLRMLPAWLKSRSFFGTAFHLWPNEVDEVKHRLDWNITLGTHDQTSTDFLASQPIL